MFIRWLGAFRSSKCSLLDSIEYEMNRADSIQFACEHINKKYGAQRIHARVGLMVNPSAIFREFRGDVWSERDNAGKLFKTLNRSDITRAECGFGHTEAWASGHPFTGIVVKGWYEVSGKSRNAIRTASEKYELPVYEINKRGKLELILTKSN